MKLKDFKEVLKEVFKEVIIYLGIIFPMSVWHQYQGDEGYYGLTLILPIIMIFILIGNVRDIKIF